MVKMEIDLTKLKELRIKAEMTRKEFAESVGQDCRELTVYRWETGKTKKPIPVYLKSLENFYKKMEKN
ncbi:MAG: helix-turn-helix domain-containing protein [Candidatus Marinimicrobia bacterium]|nr:helix-turn-helix domain-containing protein [Candidatus Neomarinimicrobiota bacterium]